VYPAAARCPVMPIPGRSRFDVYEPDRQALQCVDPSGSRPCGFPLGDGGEIGDSGRADLRELLPPLRSRIMHRRSFARGVPLSGKTIFLAALSDRVLPTTLMGFDPSQFSSCLSVPRVFPHQRAHLSFAAHPPRCFLFEGSAVKIYRSLRIVRLFTHEILRSDGPIEDARFDFWD